ncbi:MAG: hydantoinase/oxoprolinase family protein [Acidobacteriota bacterium]|nr:hydantoinase/oxoprolinase family protein [Acidobacteriota bacterium]
MWTVDIDVGGTLTDGLFSDGMTVACAKVDTTPHDLTVCLFDCLSQGAAQLGFADTNQFLEHVELIRWSTTITSNVLAESHGPRIGLLVSRGHEKDLYGGRSSSLVLNRLVSAGDVIGLGDSPDDAEIMTAARSLLERGVRRICVSLKNSHRDPAAEIEIKRVIDRQYPDHFLGSVPVLAGSDISKSPDDQTRTFCALINAYSHGALAATLFKAEDELRQTARYAGSFLVSHVNGGVAGIAKTKAIDTVESGPILGIHASAWLAKSRGIDNVIAMDIGGTTAKVSVLKNARPIYRKPSDFFGIPVSISLPYLRSIALGGGSVVKQLGGRQGSSAIQLGPESMGSFPGPACYSLGGEQATLTDAFVAAGLINPEYFLGGTKPIDRDSARQTIEELVACPLELSVEKACGLIIGRALEMVAGMIASAKSELGQDLSNHTLFAYGGNGGLFACGVAEKAGLNAVELFTLGPVFSAFGSSVSGVCHVYESTAPDHALSEAGLARIRHAVEEMKAEGAKDLLGEGLRPEGLSYAMEFEVAGKNGDSVTVPVALSALESAKKLQDALAAGFGAGAAAPRDLSLELIRLRVQKSVSTPRFAERSSQGADASAARISTRPITWLNTSGDCLVYRWESLQPGNRVEGPAVLEGVNSTYFLPEGWGMLMDGWGNGSVRRR